MTEKKLYKRIPEKPVFNIHYLTKIMLNKEEIRDIFEYQLFYVIFYR